MESPDEGIRINMNVHIESNQRASDLQHSTLTTVPIGEVYRPKLLYNIKKIIITTDPQNSFFFYFGKQFLKRNTKS